MRKLWFISTPRLKTLLFLHLEPINPVIFRESITMSNLEEGFPLRCFQRLSFSKLSYPAMPLVGQLVHQRFSHPGPLVLRTKPLKHRTPMVDRSPYCLTTYWTQLAYPYWPANSRTLGTCFSPRIGWADIAK